MANLIDLRRRIRSIKNMQQIFSAMKMISAARLRRCQDQIMATRPYALELRKVTGNLAAQSSGESAHPLLEVREEKRVLIAVVTGDKGLCGSFNANAIRSSEAAIAEHSDYELLLLGKRGADYHERRKRPVRAAYRKLFRKVTYEQAKEIAEDLSQAFLEGDYDAVYVVYNQFVSVMTQNVVVEQILPLEPPGGEEESSGGGVSSDYVYEPSTDELLATLLPRFVIFQIYRVLLESQAAEHAARMTAMESATKNSGELIDRLTLVLNRARQAAITTELIEVVSGATALEG